MDFINYTLFTVGHDTPVLLIDLLSAAAGLACVILAGRNSKYNFYAGYLYLFLLFWLFYNKNIYSNMLLQPISLAINIYGHYRWTHPKADERSSANSKSLKVSMLSRPQRVLAIASVLIFAGFWGWLLKMLGTKWFAGTFASDPVPYLDAAVTILILASQLLSAMKKWDCWVGWIFVNITQMILHISVGHVFMAVVAGFYLINGIVSLFHWHKLYIKKA